MQGSFQVPQPWQVRLAQLPDSLRESPDVRQPQCCTSEGRLAPGTFHLVKVLTRPNEEIDHVGGKSASRG